MSLTPDALKANPLCAADTRGDDAALPAGVALYPTRDSRRRDRRVPIPAGTDLVISPYITHRHPGYWKEVERFDPERFDVDRCRERHRLAYLPFSAGPRRCIGDGFALLEMQIHLCTIARALSLERPDPAMVEMEPEINLRSRGNIRMHATRR